MDVVKFSRSAPRAFPAVEASHTLRDVNRLKRILVLSASFPSAVQPVHGVFVKERVRSVNQLPGVDVRVIAPIPYFPPIRCFKRWYPWSQIPSRELIDGLDVDHPRHFFPPKIGGYLQPALMFQSVLRTVRRLQQEFDFDLIDAHFVYPSGVLAAKLGKLFNKPVVMTGRGEDMECFPKLRLIGRQIRTGLREATQLVAVSEKIAEAMRENGAEPSKITVIPNGVDCLKFRPLSREQARRELGLPENRTLILAVGYRLELKGFHILVDAIPHIRARIPDVLVAIVGGQARWARDYLTTIQERVHFHRVGDCVLMPGNRPQEELHRWYSAADMLAILSSREGSPNVLMEALACGLPVVATRVGGIPDILSDPGLGILLPERSPDAAARGIIEGLSRSWDRAYIRSMAEKQSWHEKALQIDDVFDRAICQYQRGRTGSGPASARRRRPCSSFPVRTDL